MCIYIVAVHGFISFPPLDIFYAIWTQSFLHSRCIHIGDGFIGQLDVSLDIIIIIIIKYILFSLNIIFPICIATYLQALIKPLHVGTIVN